jgi:hypothetical protein
MYVLKHGTQYVIYAPYIQRVINYKTDMEFVYDGKHGSYQPHVVRGPTIAPPPAGAAVGTSAATPAYPPATSRPAPSVALESSHAATHPGKKQNILIKSIKTLISMCRSNDAPIHESHQQMS